MKKITALICAMLVMLSLSLTVSADVPQAALDARESVVRFYSASKLGGDWYYSTGTGFVIGHLGDVTFVATNLHVTTFDIYDDKGVNIIGTYEHDLISIVDDSADKNLIMADKNQIINIRNDGYIIDMVIIPFNDYRLADIPALPLRRVADVKDGSSVYALGFPTISDEFAGNTDLLSSGISDMTSTAGTIQKINQFYENESCIQHDATLNAGSSGGPTVDSTGAVIGINTWSANNYFADNLYLSGYIDYIIDYCEAEKIPFTEAGKASAKPADADVTTVTTPIDPIPDPIPTNDLVMYIGLGVLAAAAIVVVVIYLSKKNKPAVANSAPQEMQRTMPVIPQASAAGRIKGVSGPYAGREIEVRGKMVFGRGKACSMNVPEGTRGVSTIHCEIDVSGGNLLIVDKNSSYGTFVNGSKLSPGIAVIIKSGDRFWLGSQDVTFEVL
jgi:hypothetical protein